MSAKKEVWEEAKMLYGQGFSTRAISEELSKKGIKLNQSSIFKKAKKENWVISGKGLIEKQVDKIFNKIERKIELEVIESSLGERLKSRLQVMQSLNDVLAKAITLKNKILDQTASEFLEGKIDALQASKIISNLGLNLHSIARVTGLIQEDDTIDKKESAIKVYMPENSRDIKQVH